MAVNLHLLWRFQFQHLPYETLESIADQLATQGLLQPTGDSDVWEFANQTERDIVYGRILAGQRRSLHAQVAQVGTLSSYYILDFKQLLAPIETRAVMTTNNWLEHFKNCFQSHQF